jgi:hypothetical protein
MYHERLRARMGYWACSKSGGLSHFEFLDLKDHTKYSAATGFSRRLRYVLTAATARIGDGNHREPSCEQAHPDDHSDDPDGVHREPGPEEDR